jgi:shikimate kinase
MLGPKLNPLRLALIGMSGCGKTFWANRLADAGHSVISCDSRIEERLRDDLRPDGHRGVTGLAAWMGSPDQPQYRERAGKYLAAETSVMEEVLTALERDPLQERVLDTTGSVVYTGETIGARLRSLMTVVYLQASPQEEALLIERYTVHPKPVLWRDAYEPREGETPKETLVRCFPALIEGRRKLYEAWAHCALSTRVLHEEGMNTSRLLSLIEENCRCSE